MQTPPRSCPRMHGQEQGPGSKTRMHPGKGTAPAPTRCPPTQLRQRVRVREATCEGKRAATASARSRGSPRSPLGPGARAPPAQTPAGGTKAHPPPRSRTWQQVGEPPHGALQLGRGGRVPPHVLLVPLAQQAQPPHRAGSAGRGRGRHRRRRRHGAAAALLPGPPPPRPAPSSRAGPSAERAMGGGAGV